MSGDFEKLAYEAALRGLDKQESLLDDLRVRTGALLATSSLAASFLGQEAFQDPRPGFIAIVALVAFVAATGACLFILHPKEDLVFAPESVALHKALYAADGMGGVYQGLAYDLERLWASNSKGIEELTRAFTFAAGAFLLQTLSLVGLLSDTILV